MGSSEIVRLTTWPLLFGHGDAVAGEILRPGMSSVTYNFPLFFDGSCLSHLTLTKDDSSDISRGCTMGFRGMERLLAST